MVLFVWGSLYQLKSVPRELLGEGRNSAGNLRSYSGSIDRSTEQLLSSYKICRVPSSQSIGYVCRGQEYNRFADNFEQFVIRTSTESAASPTRSSMWGKRSDPFPDGSITLVVGNSLTRQIFQSLPCQYDDNNTGGGGALVEWIDWTAQSNDIDIMRRGTFYEGRFRNGAKIFLVTNHALFYSKKWLTYLQDLIKVPIENVDQLVVGHINHFMNAYNTSFMELMMEQTKKYDDANFETVSPPTLIDFANVYNGPIVGISMMADWSYYDQDYSEMKEQVEKISGTNQQRKIKLIHGRRYINELGECGTNSWKDIGSCQDSPDSHRCIGSRGGHPDLILWDMLEAVHDISPQSMALHTNLL